MELRRNRVWLGPPWILLLGMLLGVGCKAGQGEECLFQAECQSGLVCDPTSSTCQPGFSDAGPPPPFDAGPGTDAAGPGTDAAGTDAAGPGSDAGGPGTDGGAPGSDSAAPGTDSTVTPTDAGGAWLQATLFVTSASFTGNIGGLAAADTACQTEAAAAGLPMAGDYVAILSDAALGARDRFEVLGGIERTDGALLATDEADLWDGAVLVAVNLNAAGVSSGNTLVWTGTDPNGAPDTGGLGPGFCSGWTAEMGTADIGRTDRTGGGAPPDDCGAWVSVYGGADCVMPPYPQSANPCSVSAALYCIGPRP